MGAISEAERLIEAYRITAKAAEKAEAVVKDATRGRLWRPAVAAAVTFVGSLIGSGFAAGRYFEHASAIVEAHEKRLVEIESREQQDRNHLAEAWNVAIAGKAEAERQRDRLDAHLDTRSKERM